MKTPSFFEGVGVAIALSVFGSLLFAGLTWLFAGMGVLRILIAIMSLAYVVYLLIRSREKTGRVVVITTWLLMSFVTWFLSPPLAVYLLVHILMIWLIRSLYFYTSVLPAIADLALNSSALVIAVAAAEWSNSLFLGIWSFFLVQALFVAIPGAVRDAKATHTITNDDAFERAYRAAESAVEKLSLIR